MVPDSKFNVVFFSNNVRTWKDKLVWATPKNKESLYKFVDSIRANGGTMLYDGMKEAMKIKLRKKKNEPYATNVDEIFVLSDGRPTVGSITNTNQIYETVTKWNRGAQVRIHTIYLGTQEDERRSRQQGGFVAAGMPAAEFMKRLAEDNNGKFARPNSE
jgi:Mg-chelatase subunit ChlD